MSHLVIKVGFGPSLWTQTQLAIGHLMIVVTETSHSHGQYQDSSHDCHGNKNDDSPAGALGNLDYLRETPCICPLWGKGKKRDVSLANQLVTGAQRSSALWQQHGRCCVADEI